MKLKTGPLSLELNRRGRKEGRGEVEVEEEVEMGVSG
jgi:hypothetical protein